MVGYEVDIRLSRAAKHLASYFVHGGKVLICGNGGSASTSSHVAADFVGRLSPDDDIFLPAMALTDPAIMSAIANDYGYEDVFSRQVKVYGKPGDTLLVFTTSNTSKNIIKACSMALDYKQMQVIAFCGRRPLPPFLNPPGVVFYSDVDNVQSTQEWHLHIAHQLCSLTKKFYVMPELISGVGRLVEDEKI